jgi:hypothetical protein
MLTQRRNENPEKQRITIFGITLFAMILQNISLSSSR